VKMGPIRCPETSANNYHTTPRNIPEERTSRLSHCDFLNKDCCMELARQKNHRETLWLGCEVHSSGSEFRPVTGCSVSGNEPTACIKGRE
jgi:hypothetical protein